MTLNRREAVKRIVTGGIGAAALPLWCDTLSAFAAQHADEVHASLASFAPGTWAPTVLTPHQNDTVIVLSELIIPLTETPGAKAALVNQFIDSVLEKGDKETRAEFLGGLDWLDAHSKGTSGKDFVSLSGSEQQALLMPIAKAVDAGASKDQGAQFFQAMKSLTIAGYYSSEIGMMQELGDDGQMFLLEFKGCTHPEHQV